MKKYLFLLIAIPILVAAGLTIYHYQYQSKAILRVSTTTSLYATGLLDKLAEEFSRKHPNIIIQFIPVGSGEALRRAGMGDADIVLVHAPNLEKKYLENNILVEGRIFAYNYFIIVGPPDDPASIRDTESVTSAFKRIFEAGLAGKALFISRGDNSGTHNRELFIWGKVGVEPGGGWYIESGTGMAQTLEIANEKGGYTLSDIGTYLKLKKSGVLNNLDVLFSGDQNLINIYSVYIVNPEKVEGVNYQLAKEFRDFIIRDEGQAIIREYGVKEYGAKLFYSVDSGKISELTLIWEYFASS